MRRLSNIQAFKLIMIITYIFMFSACWKAPYVDPFLVDRTQEWTPSVFYRDSYNLLRETDDAFYMQSLFFSGSKITNRNPQYVDLADNETKVLETALKTAFTDDYINCGTEKVMIVQRKNMPSVHTVLYIGGETCAIIDANDGRIVQCIDTRIQKQFKDTDYQVLQKGFAKISVDLIELSESEVKALSSYANGFSNNEMPKPFAEERDCPLDVNRAFEVSSKNLFKLYPSGRWKHIGDGEYIIYDAAASNSWLIIGEEFTMLLNKETGEKEFFSIIKSGFTDVSVPTVSTAIQGDG